MKKDCASQTDDYDEGEDLKEINKMDLWHIEKIISKARKLIIKLMKRRKMIEEQLYKEDQVVEEDEDDC